MKSKHFLIGMIALIGLMALSQAVCCLHYAYGAEVVTFKDEVRLIRKLDSEPDAVIAVLKSVLTQAQATAFETALLPPPTEAEKYEQALAAEMALKRAGLKITDPALVEVLKYRDSVKVDAAIEPIKEPIPVGK